MNSNPRICYGAVTWSPASLRRLRAAWEMVECRPVRPVGEVLILPVSPGEKGKEKRPLAA